MLNATVQQETDNKPKFIEVVATDDIKVSIKITEKDIKASSINVQTNNGTVYIRGFVRKAEKGENAGKWFFAMPSHKYNDMYVNDAGCDKALMEKINTAVNNALA